MIYILLCAYNEEKALPLLIDDISKCRFNDEYKIIIVDDGSTDATKQKAEICSNRLPIVVLSHNKNMGLGQSLKTGLTYIYKNAKNKDLIVTMDADMTHNPSLIVELSEKIKSGFDIVIASRYAEGGTQTGLSKTRKLLSYFAGAFMKALFNIKGVTDYTSGYRMYSYNYISGLFNKYGLNFITEKGFASTAELLLKARRGNVNISEVPLNLVYEKKLGASKMKIIRTIIRYFALFAKERFF